MALQLTQSLFLWQFYQGNKLSAVFTLFMTEQKLFTSNNEKKQTEKQDFMNTFVKASVLSFYLPDLCWSSFKKTNTLYGMIFGIIRIAIMLFWTVGNIPFEQNLHVS